MREVSIVTAFIGAPILIYLVRRKRRDRIMEKPLFVQKRLSTPLATQTTHFITTLFQLTAHLRHG